MGECCEGHVHSDREYLHLPDWNLKAIRLEPYCRTWSICHFTIKRGGSSSVKMAMWKMLRSKSRRISSRQGPLNIRELDLRRRTRNDSSFGISEGVCVISRMCVCTYVCVFTRLSQQLDSHNSVRIPSYTACPFVLSGNSPLKLDDDDDPRASQNLSTSLAQSSMSALEEHRNREMSSGRWTSNAFLRSAGCTSWTWFRKI